MLILNSPDDRLLAPDSSPKGRFLIFARGLSYPDSRVHPLKLGGPGEETKENGNFADLGLAFAISELYSAPLGQ